MSNAEEGAEPGKVENEDAGSRDAGAKEGARGLPAKDAAGRRFGLPTLSVVLVAGVLAGVLATMAAVSLWPAGTPAASGTSEVPTTTEPTSAPPSTTISPSEAPTVVTVPPACTQLAADGRTAADLLQQGATAARDLDASQLATVVRQMGDVKQQLEAGATACQEAGRTVTLPPPPPTS